MRSPIGIAAIYMVGVIFGIIAGWQIDVRFGTHPVEPPHAAASPAHA